MRIKLTGKRGGFAEVSPEDHEWLSRFKWNHLKEREDRNRLGSSG
jgi:hypothetical protein